MISLLSKIWLCLYLIAISHSAVALKLESVSLFFNGDLDRVYIYDKNQDALIGSIETWASSIADFKIFNENIYWQRDTILYRAGLPDFVPEEVFTLNSNTKGFDFYDNKIYIGRSDGVIEVRDAVTFDSIIELSVPQELKSFLVTPKGDLIYESDWKLHRATISAGNEIVISHVVDFFSGFLRYTYDGNFLVADKGLVFSAADLKLVSTLKEHSNYRSTIYDEGIFVDLYDKHILLKQPGVSPKIFRLQQEVYSDRLILYKDGLVKAVDRIQLQNEGMSASITLDLSNELVEAGVKNMPYNTTSEFTFTALESDRKDLVFFAAFDSRTPESRISADIYADLIVIWSAGRNQVLSVTRVGDGVSDIFYDDDAERLFFATESESIYEVLDHSTESPTLIYKNTIAHERIRGKKFDEEKNLFIFESLIGLVYMNYDGQIEYSRGVFEHNEANCLGVVISPLFSYECDERASLPPSALDTAFLLTRVGNYVFTLSDEFLLSQYKEGELLDQFYVEYSLMTRMNEKLVLLDTSLLGTKLAILDPLNPDDDDVDGLINLKDNCPHTSNFDQLDHDKDSIGDACDTDIDGDFLPNEVELSLGLDPFNRDDASLDLDRDGFTNIAEFSLKSGVNDSKSTPPPSLSFSTGAIRMDGLTLLSSGKNVWSSKQVIGSGGLYATDDIKYGPSSAEFSFYIYSLSPSAVSIEVSKPRSLQGINVFINENFPDEIIEDVDSGKFMIAIKEGVNKVSVRRTNAGYPFMQRHRIVRSELGIVKDIVIDFDADFDGINNFDDSCPLLPSPINLHDSDGDGLGDECDGNPTQIDNILDLDNDGISDNMDNCSNVPNSQQHDFDRDIIGDSCDDDIDGDGATNYFEELHGSSSYQPDHKFNLEAYFIEQPGIYVYANSEGEIFERTIFVLSNGSIKAVTPDGYYNKYYADQAGLKLTEIGEGEQSLPFSDLLVIPASQVITTPEIHQTSHVMLEIDIQTLLLEYGSFEFEGERFAAATFEVTQSSETTSDTAVETYALGLGMVQVDDFVLKEILPLPPSYTAEAPPAEQKKKKEKKKWFGSIDSFLLFYLSLLMMMFSSKKTDRILYRENK